MPSDRRHEAVEGGVRCGQCGEEWETPLGAARCCEMEIVTDGGTDQSTGDTEQQVTSEWLEGRYFCYPVECAACGKELAGAEENAAISTGDALPIDGDGLPLCRDHPERIAFVAAGVYAHGGGVPCDTGRSFRPEDVVDVRSVDTDTDQDGGRR